MKPYKALQNKALHQGMYISYCVALSDQFTTNGHMMIRKVVTQDELKPIKGQFDLRNNGEPMKDMSSVITGLRSKDTSTRRVTDGEDAEVRGMKCTIAKGEGMEVTVQQVYLDYVNSVFDGHEWWMTSDVVFASIGSEVIAVIARVKDEDEQ